MAPLVAAIALMGRLEVSTGTPDALCPTVAEVETAIVARVGELEDATYHVHYDLVRSASNETKTLRVVLMGERDDVLFRRELNLDSCESAAPALALVVERYFEKLASGEPDPDEGGSFEAADAPSAPPRETVSDSREGKSPPKSSQISAKNASSRAPDPTRKSSPLFVRGVLALGERPTFEVGLGVGYSLSPRLSFGLDATWLVTSRREEGSTYAAENEVVRLVPGLRYSWRWTDWALGLGPVVPFELEWVQGERLTGVRSLLRVVPALGGDLTIHYRLNADWSLELGTRLAGRLTGVTNRFVVGTLDGSSREILGLDPFFVQAYFSAVWGGL